MLALGDDATLEVFSHLGVADLARVACACRELRRLETAFWDRPTADEYGVALTLADFWTYAMGNARRMRRTRAAILPPPPGSTYPAEREVQGPLPPAREVTMTLTCSGSGEATAATTLAAHHVHLRLSVHADRRVCVGVAPYARRLTLSFPFDRMDVDLLRFPTDKLVLRRLYGRGGLFAGRVAIGARPELARAVALRVDVQWAHGCVTRHELDATVPAPGLRWGGSVAWFAFVVSVPGRPGTSLGTRHLGPVDWREWTRGFDALDDRDAPEPAPEFLRGRV